MADLAESAYWAFDAYKKGYTESKLKHSERDAFKMAVREEAIAPLAKALEAVRSGDHQGCAKASIPDEGECSECIIERALESV